jgi:hypothetical protein
VSEPASENEEYEYMALRTADARVGAIAYFDHELLLAEPDVDKGDDGLNRPGPFVCVETVGDRSVWSAITGEARQERLLIEAIWRRDGSDAWRTMPQYLNDGLATYLGPTAAFVRAGSRETPFTRFRRPSISQDGIQAILAEIRKQGGTLLSDPPEEGATQ